MPTNMCPYCQKENKPGARFCQKCGQALSNPNVTKPMARASQARPLARLRGTQSLPSVLKWGQQLADVLTQLHSQQQYLSNLSADQILIDEAGKIRLADSIDAKTILSGQYDRVAAESARQLALILRTQLQGQSIPPRVLDTLNQASADNQTLFSEPQQLIQALQAVIQTEPAPAPAPAAPLTRPIPSAQASVRSQTAARQTIRLRVGQLTDVGRERTMNEDMLWVRELEPGESGTSPPIGLFVVADGMGGHEAGEVASKQAITALQETLWPQVQELTHGPATPQGDAADQTYKKLLTEACQEAAQRVHARARQLGKDLGTTLVVALVVGSRAYIANVGDSRLYKLNRTGIQRITEDHSMVERLVKHQMLSPQEARHHPQANLIYRSLGDRATVEIDTFQEQLHPGDLLLLCSDGLSGQVEDSQIHQIATTHPPQDACQHLVRAANAAGGPDNITVVIVEVIGK